MEPVEQRNGLWRLAKLIKSRHRCAVTLIADCPSDPPRLVSVASPHDPSVVFTDEGYEYWINGKPKIVTIDKAAEDIAMFARLARICRKNPGISVDGMVNIFITGNPEGRLPRVD